MTLRPEIESCVLPEPRGNEGTLEVFAACWPRFRARLAKERADGEWIDYVGIADMGREFFDAFAGGCNEPWIGRIFEAIEHVLTHGDDQAQNLVVVGLFEAVQGLAYHAGAAGDRFEAALLPHARKAWADLIEGWTYPGIRDLAAWRALPPSPR